MRTFGGACRDGGNVGANELTTSKERAELVKICFGNTRRMRHEETQNDEHMEQVVIRSAYGEIRSE